MMDSDITLRREGGHIRRMPAATSNYHFRQLRRIILVHGFNTNEDSAVEGYEKFKAHCSAVSRSLGEQMLTLAWPGDRWPRNWFKYYGHNIASAEESATALADFLAEYIEREQVPCEYVFIAHSLGCRLVVLLLHNLKKRGVAIDKRFKIFLMAPAIPIHLLSANSELRAAVGEVALSAVLYSRSDKVLKRYFGLGEPLDPQTHAHANPVGLTGEPPDVWTLRPQEMKGFDHEYYWTNVESAQYIAKQLGHAVDCPLPERRVAERPPLDARVRETFDPRQLGEWQDRVATTTGAKPTRKAIHPVSDAPSIGRLHTEGLISDEQYDAARRFYAYWYLTGLGGDRHCHHPDYVATIVPPTTVRNEHESHFSQRHLEDLAFIGTPFADLACAVLLDGLEPVAAGAIYLGREGSRARESVIDILRMTLEALIHHYE